VRHQPAPLTRHLRVRRERAYTVLEFHGEIDIAAAAEIAKGSTVLELLDRLREAGPRSVRVACTHGLFAADALKRLGEQPDVLEIVCTNTVPVPAGHHTDKLRVLSVAPAFAEAVRRIHNGESVSALFDAPPTV
jgi:ribose-phosphate pyrophosphokinase